MGETVTYMDVTYTRKEWNRLMRSVHYQYKWSTAKSSKGMRASSLPRGVKGVTKEMRDMVDRLIYG